MISTSLPSSAKAATIHELLVDVGAWRVWSPHVASVRADSDRVAPGWVGSVRAFFSPAPTVMIVDQVRANGGYSWHSSAGPWRLDYENHVAPDGDGSVLTFTAGITGPGAGLIERIVAPVSAYGQRRRMSRLSQLAELVETHAV